MPKISVLTSVYIDSDDKLQWFREMLQSVKNQSFTDFEHIIVDDYSPISLEELKLTTSADSRFRWFKAHGNQGPAACRNTAAALAESDAIIVLDADDLFGNDITLETMYNVWQEDTRRVVYGNLQLLVKSNNNYTRGKVISLGEYTFENSLNLEGLFPVTALHSLECHREIGGWSTELSAGLEDVEYWIGAGERGYCGWKVNHTTLLYRKHRTSRAWHLRHGINGNPAQENKMRQKIIDLHQSTFNGDWPMGCCGGNKKTTSNGAPRVSAKITTLDDFRDEDKVWVQYQGNKDASFRVAANHTSPVKQYVIQGVGHTFQIHRNDIDRFKSFAEHIRGQRQSAYIFPNKAPEEVQPELVEVSLSQREPEMAVIERLDKVAVETRQIEIVEEPLPQPELVEWQFEQPVIESEVQSDNYDLSSLNLSASVQSQLVAESWSLEKLATAAPDELMSYRGIGEKRAKDIISKAQQYI
jgi:GT2 family glycosyltransferase